MATSDKNIIITPNIGQNSDPKIAFSGANTAVAAQTINLNVYPTDGGTISFEGSAGQLFSITNKLTGTIFSVNDVSGIPSIEVLDTGLVKLAQYSGNVLIGTGTSNGTDKLQVNGSIISNSTITGGSLTVSGTTQTAGHFYAGTTTPTGTTRLNYSGYFYPTFINLAGSGDTTTAASHYIVETGSDGFLRPKTLASVRTEVVTTAAVNSAAATTVGTVTSGTWSATNIALNKGGTNAALTAINGGVVYSSASAMAISAAGTSGQYLKSNGTGAPTWDTPSGGQFFGSAATKAIAYNANTISENVTVTTGNNGLSAGPITIANGFTVTVANGANWVIV
jgi:hypothetical protein